MFEKREDGFENAFAHEEALRFKALARRNHLIGLWAAETLGLAREEAAAYASALVGSQVLVADDEALVAQLASELAPVTPAISEHRLRQRLAQAGAQAAEQIQSGR